MGIRRVIVCEVQVPFVQGGAEYHVRALHQQLRAHGYRGRARQHSVQVVSERGNSRACRGVAADRSERDQRRADRSGDRHEVPVVFRAPSQQGRVAHSSVPRRVRAVRHRVQRLLAHRRRCRPAADADRARHEMLGECRRVFANRAEHREQAREVQRPDGTSRCIIRRRLPTVSGPGPYGDYVLFVGRLESIKRPDLAVRAMQHVDRPIRLVVVGDGTQRARTEELAASLGRGGSHRLCRVGRRAGARRSVQGSARRRVQPIRRGLRLRDARIVSRAQAGDHDHRRRRPARVRRARDERLRV